MPPLISPKGPTNVICKIPRCQAKESDAEKLREGICPYCVHNDAATSKERDYSTAILEGGY